MIIRRGDNSNTVSSGKDICWKIRPPFGSLAKIEITLSISTSLRIGKSTTATAICPALSLSASNNGPEIVPSSGL